MSAAFPGTGPVTAVIALDRCFGCGLEVIGMQIPGSPLCFDCHEKAAAFAIEHRAKLIGRRAPNGGVQFAWMDLEAETEGTDLVEYAR